MKVQKLLFAILLTVLFVTGCSNRVNVVNEVENQAHEVIVQKRVGDKNEYPHFRGVSDAKLVSKAITILDEANWENAKVEMENPPHYKFNFNYANNEIKSNRVIYALWISPNKDKIELVMQGESKYVQLTKEKSAELFEIITGSQLSDLN